MGNYSASTVAELISAIIAANDPEEEDSTITLTATTFDLSEYNLQRIDDPHFELILDEEDEDGPISGLPVIKNSMTIQGAGAADTIITRTVDGDETTMYRLIAIAPGADLTLKNLTLTRGNVGSLDIGGAAVCNFGNLSIEDCSVGPENRSNYGAIRTDAGGTTEVRRCDIFGNECDWGGGLYNYGAGATQLIYDSVIRDNNAGNGGGIVNFTTTEIHDCVITGNGYGGGGGVANYGGTTTIEGSWICDNRGYVGAIHNQVGSVTANNCHIAGNYPLESSDISVVNSDPEGQIDVRYNWWGKADGPYPQDINGPSVLYEPYLTTPTPSSCDITGASTGKVYRGPSRDDLLVPVGSLTFPRQAQAWACDDAGKRWYGFIHPDRSGVYSWVSQEDGAVIKCSIRSLTDARPAESPLADWDTTLTMTA